MNVATVSILRDGAGYIPRFVGQLAGLRDVLATDGLYLRSIVIEGDSVDGSWDLLQAAFAEAGLRADLGQHHHGGARYGSVDETARWRNVSQVYNVALARLDPLDDVVIQLDPDLLWAPETLAQLAMSVVWGPAYDAVAPGVFHAASGRWYDTWGFRALDGRRFTAKAPYHPDGWQSAPARIGSAGGCLAVSADYARQARFDPPEQANVGWCAQLRNAGALLWWDPTSAIVHLLE